MMKIELLNVKYHNRIVGTLSLAPDNKLCAFEYAPSWLADGFSISPLELPLRKGLFLAKPSPFFGNFGIFEDSLPDGYGRYLLHKLLQKEGIDDFKLSALDHLSIVGSGGMGALTFEPETSIKQGTDVTDFDLLHSDDEGHWLVKFRHTYDPQDMGQQEYHYNEVARKCGISVPDFKLINGRYFASRRFDIDAEGNRIHTATAGGLLCISLSNPVLDYSNLVALTGYLTQNPRDVEEMYRRMVFNYLTDNKDDHCKNFSFIVLKDRNGSWKWHLAPAYDLTLCTEGYNGEHATSVNGTGHPTLKDFIAVGTKIKMNEQRCREIIEEVRCNCDDLMHYTVKF